MKQAEMRLYAQFHARWLLLFCSHVASLQQFFADRVQIMPQRLMRDFSEMNQRISNAFVILRMHQFRENPRWENIGKSATSGKSERSFF